MADTKQERSGEGEKVTARENWSSHCDYFLSSLGLAVGLGNIWRFPYVCYSNGSGTFLVPYVMMLVLVGIPGLLLEQSLGQYARVGVNKVYGRMAPLFKGFGYSVICIIFFSELYFAMICGWTILYMFLGMQSELPWSTCQEGNLWHTRDCFSVELQEANCQPGETYYNLTCVPNDQYCRSHGYDLGYLIDGDNRMCIKSGTDPVIPTDLFSEVLSRSIVSPAEDYFNGFVLGFTKDDGSGERHSWTDFGRPRWMLVLSLMAVWLVETLILFKGLKFYGKFMYFLTLSPYVVLIAFLAYGLTLDGAAEGIDKFMSPKWEELKDINVWYTAASQILLSLSLGMGAQVALSSFNDFKNNTVRDAVAIAIGNSATSLLAGFVVFAILGYLAAQTGSNIEDVVNDGITMALVTYPSAMLKMDVPPLWSFLFFFMLVNLAIASGCGGLQTIATFLMDEFPALRPHRMKVFMGLSSVLFLFGLPMTCNGGILLVTLFDRRCTSSLLFILWIEVVLVVWVYGISTFLDDIQEMAGPSIVGNKTIRLFLKVIYLFVTPGVLIVTAVIAWATREPISYDGKEFPAVAEGIGWVLELGPLAFAIVMPIPKIYLLIKDGLTPKMVAKSMLSPTQKWFDTDRGTSAKEGIENEAMDVVEMSSIPI